MNKDVIYIDVEDDITGIIGKIKDSKEKIVALVPPRRVGVLQSAVNLRLLDRMAKEAGKKLVIVTNNAALVALTSAAKIPVAKNLQSKPEVAEVPALVTDDEDDIIDGSQLPVGELAEATDEPEAKAAAAGAATGALAARLNRPAPKEEVIEGISIDEPIDKKATPKTKKVKIPNYDKFRKRLFFGIGGAILLAALLVWMYVIAPAATVIITAKTSPSQVSATLSLGGQQATDYKTGVISSETQSTQQSQTVKFNPTGSAQVGDKASGSVVFSNPSQTSSASVPAGTTLTSTDGFTYVTNSSVTVPNATVGRGSSTNGKSSPVGITATAVGSDYNQDSGTTFTVSGQPLLLATASSDISGGDSHTVTVVSDADVQQAKSQVQSASVDAIKKQLKAKFKNGETVIDSSFTATPGDATSSPAIGQQLPSGTSQATLTVPTTYSIVAVPKQALDSYLQDALKDSMDGKNQKIYDNGSSKASFSGYLAGSDNSPATATLSAVGQIGPVIDQAQIKKIVAGQKYGTIEEQINASTFPGVQDVAVKYSYPWVSHVPKNQDKITVQFKVTNGK